MLRRPRRGIARSVLVAVSVLVVLGAAVGGYFVYTNSRVPTASTLTSTSNSTQSATSAGTGSVEFALELTPNNMLISPGMTINYTSLSIVVVSAPSTPQSISLRASTSSEGLTATLSSVTASTQGQGPITLTVVAASSVPQGTYQITLSGSVGLTKSNSTFTIRVVPYLVLIKSNQFIPDSISVVKDGSVVWMNLDGSAHMETGYHVVQFVTGTTAESPTLHQYDTWALTFNSTGTFDFQDSLRTTMQGVVTVN